MIDGLLVVDKPCGMTSHDVVGRCRKVFGQRRVGHAGTLDPDATGVLVVGLGQATRLLSFVSDGWKSYDGEVVLGVSTTTLDASGELTSRSDMHATTLGQARLAAEKLTGNIEQVPPMVSAIKIGGRRLHALAREGIEVERPPRAVTVSRFDLEMAADQDPGPLGGSGPVLAISVDCSSGTYVRTLAADLGSALGGDAHLRRLRRSAVGRFTLADATPLDEVGPERVLPPAAALTHLPSVTVEGDLAAAVGHGQVLGRSALGLPDAPGSPSGEGTAGEGPWAVLDQDGRLLAVYAGHGPGRAKPVIVLSPTGR